MYRILHRCKEMISFAKSIFARNENNKTRVIPRTNNKQYCTCCAREKICILLTREYKSDALYIQWRIQANIPEGALQISSE